MNTLNDNTPEKLKLSSSNLYLKLSKSKYIKVANSIHIYNYYIDSLDNIHICYLDFKKRLVYALWQNGILRKKNICKLVYNKKNISDIKIYIFNETLNIFIIKSTSLNLNNIIHINYDFTNSSLFEYTFNALCFSNLSCYKSHLDSNFLILKLEHNPECTYTENIFQFDLQSKSWSSLNEYNVNQDWINYCRSLSYK